MQRRDKGVLQSLGSLLTSRVHGSRVLLVGAGGIGCEVLKNLVCCGFGSSPTTADAQRSDARGPPCIVVVDLDTIDLSNLNRQFLFRKQHVKQAKAFVAKETASQFNPSVKIDAQHASIFDGQYNVDFFRRFDLVFNALDNLAARRQVNRMCLAAGVPLIESGTTGYNGQVQAIKKGVTECYDCNPKPVQTSYPICTIRSTPSQPIHCIVWAKSYLLPELFGDASEEQSSEMKITDNDDAEEVAKLQSEADALKRIRSTMGQPEFAQAVFDQVFGEDVERLRSMSEMWKMRKPPEALRFHDLTDDLDASIEKGRELITQDKSVWSLKENAEVFLLSVQTLSSRSLLEHSPVEFDKDDKDTLDFVASAANLRAHIFGIASTSEWNIKQMAGNIIPAVATSNAMTASLCVSQAFKILRATLHNKDTESLSNGNKPSQPLKGSTSMLGGAKMIFLTSKNADRVISSEALHPPNPLCAVCSPVYAQLQLPGDRKAILKELVDLLRDKLGYDEFSISTESGIIFDPDEDENIERALEDFGIQPNSNGFLTVTDDADKPRVDLVLSVHTQSSDSLELDLTDLTLPLKPQANVSSVEVTSSNGITMRRKRKREDDVEEETAHKKSKDESEVQEAILIEDDGTILLDDD